MSHTEYIVLTEDPSFSWYDVAWGVVAIATVAASMYKYVLPRFRKKTLKTF